MERDGEGGGTEEQQQQQQEEQQRERGRSSEASRGLRSAHRRHLVAPRRSCSGMRLPREHPPSLQVRTNVMWSREEGAGRGVDGQEYLAAFQRQKARERAAPPTPSPQPFN